MGSGGLASTYRRYARSSRKRRAWSAENPGNRAIREELNRRVVHLAGDELQGGGEILDIGCGSGYWLRRLADLGIHQGRLRGIDALTARVAVAARLLPDARIDTGDARELPYPDDRFGLILMFTLLSSLPTAGAVADSIGEALRVLKPRGRLLIYEPRIPNPFNRSTRTITRRAIAGATDEGTVIWVESLTVLPPLARRLGKATERVYPVLSRVPALRTHRLFAIRPAGR